MEENQHIPVAEKKKKYSIKINQIISLLFWSPTPYCNYFLSNFI